MRPVYSWASYSRSFSGLPFSHFASFFFSDTVTFSISAGFLGRLVTFVSVSPSLRHNLPPFLPLLLTLSLCSPLSSSVGLLERESCPESWMPLCNINEGKAEKNPKLTLTRWGVGCRSRDVKDRGRKIDWEAGKEWGRPVVCLDPNFLFMLTFIFFFFCRYIHIKSLLYSSSDWKLKGRRTRGNSRKQLLECRPG